MDPELTTAETVADPPPATPPAARRRASTTRATETATTATTETATTEPAATDSGPTEKASKPASKRPAEPPPALAAPTEPVSRVAPFSPVAPVSPAESLTDHLLGDHRTRELRPSRAPETRSGSLGGADQRGNVRVGEPRPAAAEPTVPTNIYRARRPAVAALLIIPAALVGLLFVRALAISAFGTTFLINGVIASSLALASLPLLVAGLYGLMTGAAHGAEQWGFRVWARPPLAYLVVGLIFAVAAGLAIS